jgi:hypothetical protein
MQLAARPNLRISYALSITALGMIIENLLEHQRRELEMRREAFEFFRRENGEETIFKKGAICGAA